jgi:hypothetical protein
MSLYEDEIIASTHFANLKSGFRPLHDSLSRRLSKTLETYKPGPFPGAYDTFVIARASRAPFWQSIVAALSGWQGYAAK